MRRVAGFLYAFLLVVPAAHAEISGSKVKIGVLTDLSGPYEAGAGMGSVEAAKIAAEEFDYKINGVPIEIISADHQNKPDIGAGIARRWFDLEGVDAVTDLVNSGVAFATLEVAKAANKAVLLTSAGSADFTGKACAPNNLVHWVYDTYQLGASIGQALDRDHAVGRELGHGDGGIGDNGTRRIGHRPGHTTCIGLRPQGRRQKGDDQHGNRRHNQPGMAFKAGQETGCFQHHNVLQKTTLTSVDSLERNSATFNTFSRNHG